MSAAASIEAGEPSERVRTGSGGQVDGGIVVLARLVPVPVVEVAVLAGVEPVKVAGVLVVVTPCEQWHKIYFAVTSERSNMNGI